MDWRTENPWMICAEPGRMHCLEVLFREAQDLQLHKDQVHSTQFLLLHLKIHSNAGAGKQDVLPVYTFSRVMSITASSWTKQLGIIPSTRCKSGCVIFWGENSSCHGCYQDPLKPFQFGKMLTATLRQVASACPGHYPCLPLEQFISALTHESVLNT
eukprot:1148266-Pelagomonas_calceolata.AAC.1